MPESLRVDYLSLGSLAEGLAMEGTGVEDYDDIEARTMLEVARLPPYVHVLDLVLKRHCTCTSSNLCFAQQGLIQRRKGEPTK